MKNKKGGLKNKILAGVLASSFLFGGKAIAQEIKFELPKISKENTLVRMPNIDLENVFDFETERDLGKINYSSQHYTAFEGYSPKVHLIARKIREGEIGSYESLLENSKDLTNNQKIAMLSYFSSNLNLFVYNLNYNGENYSQEDFFKFLNDSLNRKEGSMGNCKYITAGIDKLAEDADLNSAIVQLDSTRSHVGNIIKTGEGISLVNYSNIISSNSKNIEKLLNAYQNEIGFTSFSHMFFKNSQLKYELITKEGEIFFDFADYDSSLKEIKSFLIDKKKIPPELAIKGIKGDKISSLCLNAYGLYLNLGDISETNFPKEGFDTFQLGFKRKFFPSEELSIYPNASFLFGKEDDSYLNGFTAGLIINTEKERGLNLSSKFSATAVSLYKKILFENYTGESGISYTSRIKNINLTPYLLTQFAVLPTDFPRFVFAPRLSELESGVSFSLHSSTSNFSIEPHYTKRISEDEFGVRVKMDARYFGVSFEGYLTKSGYIFCPDKSGLNAEFEMKLNPLTINGRYKADTTNYDREIETNNSFSLTGKLKLN